MATTGKDFRTCEVTGFKVHRPAERLIIWNAVTAVLFLALGGILALTIALTRWEAVHLLSSEMYYRFVSAHGVTMLVFWIVFFEIAGLYFAGSVVLNAPLFAPKTAWLAYILMAVGAIMTEVVTLSGKATVMFTAYPPLKAHPLFYLGVILFAVGALVAVILFLVNVVLAKARGYVNGSLPLVTYAFVAAAVLAVFTLLSGALAFVPALLWALNLIPSVDPAAFRLFYWGFGHGAQQVNLAAMVGVWYALATLTTGARALNEGLSRFAFLLYVLFIQMGSIHHLLVDPGLGTGNRIMNTSYFLYLAVLASMVHAFSIPSAVEVAQRAKGYTRGLFQWIRKAPWGEPGFAALATSFVIFGFLAGVSGVIMGTMQINMIAHNTLIVPAHFHMTVVAGTTIAFMGIAYYLIPLITRRQLVGRGIARIQPYLYGFGLVVFFAGMFTAGQQGVPRRHWDITFGGAAIPVEIFQTPHVNLSLTLLGIGAIIAVIGGGLFIAVAVSTLLFGKVTSRPDLGRLALAPMDGLAAAPPTGGLDHGHGAGRRLEAPGTMVLVFIFLAWFMLMYLAAWINLSDAWPVS